MNILIGLHSYNINGILKSALNFSTYLKKNKSNVHIIINAPDSVAAGKQLFLDIGCEVHSESLADSLLEKLKTQNRKIDLVFRESFFSPDLKIISTYFNCPYFIRNHDWLPLTSRSSEWFTAHKSAEEYFLESEGQNIIFVGEKVREYYSDLSKKHNIHQYVCYPSIDTFPLEQIEFNSAPSEFTILQLGTVYNRKGCLQTLEAFHLFLKQTNIAAKLVFIGARYANERESEYIKELEVQVEHLGLKSCVQILATHPFPFTLIKNFDLLTLHSLSECTPLVIFEALFLGKPIVSSNVGAISELVHSDRTGYLFEYGDVKQQAEYFMQIYSNRNAWKNKAAQIHDFFMQRFSPEILNNHLRSILNV